MDDWSNYLNVAIGVLVILLAIFPAIFIPAFRKHVIGKSCIAISIVAVLLCGAKGCIDTNISKGNSLAQKGLYDKIDRLDSSYKSQKITMGEQEKKLDNQSNQITNQANKIEVLTTFLTSHGLSPTLIYNTYGSLKDGKITTHGTGKDHSYSNPLLIDKTILSVTIEGIEADEASSYTFDSAKGVIHWRWDEDVRSTIIIHYQ